jgi:type I restriction enzyme, S subunit
MRNVRSRSTANLGDLVEFVGGGTPRRDNPDFWGGPIAWASVKDLTGTDLVSTAERITEQGLRNSATNLIGPGTVIVATRVGLGKVCINRVPVAINQDLKALIPRNGAVLARFLLYFLLSQAGLIERSGVGATVKGVTIPFLQNLKLFLPSLTEQKEIVRALDAAQELTGLRAEADRRTADLIPAIFYEMFGDPVVNADRWNRAKLGELCTIRRGASPRPIDNYLGGTIPWIKIGDGTGGDELYIENTAEKIIEDGRRKSVYLEPGSLIFANCGVSLGFARILKIGGCIHDGWLALENISPKLDRIYLLKLINSISEHFRRIAPSGTQPNLNTGIMKNFPIAVPPLPLQRQFAARVAEVRALEAQQAASRQRLDDLFQSMLHRAFRGEL